MILNEIFFLRERGTQSKGYCNLYLERNWRERERERDRERETEYHPADFKENLYTEMHPPLEFLDFFHGGITLCIYVIPLFYPRFFFSTPSLLFYLFLSLIYYPFFRLSFRILIIPVALFCFFSFFSLSLFFLYPCKHIERTRPEEEIIAFWHRGIASISRYCSRRSRLLHFITAGDAVAKALKKKLDIARE